MATMLTQAAITKAIKDSTKTGRSIMLSDPGARGAGRLVLKIRCAANTGGVTTIDWYVRWTPRSGQRRFAKVGTYSVGSSKGLGLADARRAYQTDFLPAIQQTMAHARVTG